ncbi:MAG: alanyl-tRNA editing protein [Gemmatimonadales bacterium]
MPDIHQRRPYYADSYLTSFEATVTAAGEVAGQPTAVLDRTWFYPSSGGQPNDSGTLGDRRVVDVQIHADGEVVHVLDGPVALGPIRGAIDWPRRWDHMQQHTGQHILSQAFVRLADAATIGFHLGVDYVSIDLDTAHLSDSRREAAFALANDVVQRGLEVRAWFPGEAELAAIQLRKTPDVEGALRVVAIGDFDVSACGGTHVRRTSEIALIHWLRTERLKRGVRVAFHCGDRARSDYAAKQRIIGEVAAALACAASELPAAVARLQAEAASLRRAVEKYQDDALDREAVALRVGAERHGALLVVRKHLPERSPDEIKALAMRLTAEPGVVALFATSGQKTHMIFARDEGSSLLLKPALDAALAAIGGGKGGGSRIVQGGGAPATIAQIEGALAAALKALVP